MVYKTRKGLYYTPSRLLLSSSIRFYSLHRISQPFTWLVPGLLIGGEKRKSEKARLRKGITILIGTPGRLLDHAKNTKNVTFHHLKWLIIDEADRLFELGYEKFLKK